MEGLKVCRKCLEPKLLEEFTFKRRKNGNKTARAWCRKCSYQYRREYYASSSDQQEKLKASNKHQKTVISAYVEQIKKAPCVDCGNHWPSYVLDFDHRDPSTKVDNVGNLRRNGASLEKIKAEITKCDLVCANCHRIRTHRKRNGPDIYYALT